MDGRKPFFITDSSDWGPLRAEISAAPCVRGGAWDPRDPRDPASQDWNERTLGAGATGVSEGFRDL